MLCSASVKHAGSYRARNNCTGKHECVFLLLEGMSSLWVEFVVDSLLRSEVFFPGTTVFPSPQKPTFPNSNSILECELLGAPWVNKRYISAKLSVSSGFREMNDAFNVRLSFSCLIRIYSQRNPAASCSSA